MGLQKATTIAWSTIDAEYRAIAHTANKVHWLQSLLRELRFPCQMAPIIWMDNLSAKYLTTVPIFHSRSKHLEIDFHFVQDKVTTNAMHVCYLSSKDQIADIHTKSLPKRQFCHLRSRLSVHSHPIQLKAWW